MSLERIPTVDYNKWANGTAADKEKFAEDLGKSFSEIGFAIVSNHGISDNLRQNLFTAVRRYFSLPEEIKEKYVVPGLAGQRGHTLKGMEHARDRTTGDLKEFFHVGQEIPPEDPDFNLYPVNTWPREIPQFKAFSIKIYRKFELLGGQLLRAVAMYLDQRDDFFDDKIYHGNSILRPIHYFPIEDPDEIEEGAVRAAEHEDINLITLLMGASADGLQVQRKDGKWIDVNLGPDQLVINVGDMLQRLSNDKLRSTAHRVVNPPKDELDEPRYSIPFFLHPRSEMDLTCLPTCVDKENPKKYEDISAGAYLNERLREIGLL